MILLLCRKREIQPRTSAGVGDGSGDFVRNTSLPTGFTGSFLSADTDDDLYRRSNDPAFRSAIPTNAVSTELSFLLTANSSSFALMGILDSVNGVPRHGNTNFGV